MRFLLTGFEPFGGDDVNSSQEVVRTLSCDESGGVELETSILPVSFKRAGNAICRLLDATEPDVVIMLGQSSKSNCIKIERVALNLMDSCKGDNDGLRRRVMLLEQQRMQWLMLRRTCIARLFIK